MLVDGQWVREPHKTKVILIGKGYGWWEAPQDVPPDTDVWGINDLVMKRINLDLIFNMHLLEDYSEMDMACVKMADQLNIPVVMPKAYDILKSGIEFPLEQCMKKFDTDYFMTGIAYMIAYAIMQGYEQIDTYGINMRGIEEKYKNARASVDFWFGVAKGRRIKVNVRGKYADCLKIFDRRLYGYKYFQTYPECINDRALYVTYGVGLDRKALDELHGFLSKQPDSKYHNNFNPIPVNDTNMNTLMYNFQKIIYEIGDGVKRVGDIGFYNLIHIDNIINNEHNSRFICLQGNKEEMLADWLHFAGDHNFWTDPNSKHWNGCQRHKYEMFFPKYDLPKEQALAKFIDDFYMICKRAQIKYPGFVKNWDSSVLKTRQGQKELLEFIECKDSEMVLTAKEEVTV